MSVRTLRAIVVVTVVSTGAFVLLPALVGPVGRLALGLPLLFVFPGYVTFRLLFPKDASTAGRHVEGIPFDVGTTHSVVTLGLSIGFSVVIVPVVARVLLAAGAYSSTNLALAIGGLVVLGAALAARRDPGVGATTNAPLLVVAHEWIGAARSYFRRDRPVGTVASVLVVLSVAFFLGGVGFAFATSPAAESYTEFYLLSENESGELVASDYPSELDSEDSTPLVIGIENHEGQTTSYTVVAELQRVENGTVTEARELDRFETRLQSNESTHLSHDVRSPMAGDRLRLQYDLYLGDAPAIPGDGPEETLYLNVSSAGT